MPRPTEKTPPTLDVTAEQARAGLKAVFGLFERWDLTEQDCQALLGNPDAETCRRWRNDEIDAVPTETMWRLGDLLGIHAALRQLFEEPARGYAWIKRPNSAFGGHSALETMLRGASDITDVRRYLVSQIGP